MLTAAPLARRLSWFGPPQILGLALVLGAAMWGLAPPFDPDLWWHLRTGGWILDHHRLPGVDPFSLVARGHRWVTHEWLAEVAYAGAYRWLGYRGVSILRALLVGTLAGSLTVASFRRTTPYRAVLVSFVAIAGTVGGWGERPQLFSFVLVVPVAAYLRSCVDRDRPLWPLVGLSWLWANLHGLYILGIALTVLAAAGVLLDHGRAGRDRAVRLGLTAFAMTAVAGLTPNGPRLLLAPLDVASYAHFVSEWRAPDVRKQIGACLIGLLLVTVAGWARSREPVPRSEVVWVAFAALVGFSYARTVVVGVALLAPLAAERSRDLWPARREPTPGPALLNGAFVAVLAALWIGGVGVLFGTQPELPRKNWYAPTRAILAQPGPHRLLPEYDLGSWALWQARTAPPLIDGRTELYEPAYVQRYFDLLGMRGNWRATLAELRPTVAWLRHGTPIVFGLRRGAGWRTVYADDQWVVMVPPASSPATSPASSP